MYISPYRPTLANTDSPITVTLSTDDETLLIAAPGAGLAIKLYAIEVVSAGGGDGTISFNAHTKATRLVRTTLAGQTSPILYLEPGWILYEDKALCGTRSGATLPMYVNLNFEIVTLD